MREQIVSPNAYGPPSCEYWSLYFLKQSAFKLVISINRFDLKIVAQLDLSICHGEVIIICRDSIEIKTVLGGSTESMSPLFNVHTFL